ncbi:hypothetical protein GGI18_004410 [Coemansia linderi]|uniref:Uncharacterized protein n=1 Tax=Coemansia linderi TaxID=2663919 RepID=A0ACC1K905_9FUNG|nr:hypothetical protein GGI18_004410 [Coemansia linderi]
MSLHPYFAMHNQDRDTAQSIFAEPTTAETVVFFVSLAVNLSSFLLLGYAIWFREYPPMRAQHVAITVAIGIGGIIFNISNNLVQGMARYEGFLGVCKFWGAWVLLTFGLAVFLSSMNMRLVLFYRIFVTGNTYIRPKFSVTNFFRRFWPLIAIWSPSFISSIVISSISGPRGAWLLEDHGLRACDFSEEYLYWIYAYFAAQIVLSWILYFRMRKVAKVFNGFRMAIWTLLIFTATLLISMVINIIEGSNYPWGRIAIALSNMILINGYLWLILGPPVIGHLFWREQTMRNFMNSLHKDSLIAQQTRAHGLHARLYGMPDVDAFSSSPYSNHDVDDSFIDNENNPEHKPATAATTNFAEPAFIPSTYQAQNYSAPTYAISNYDPANYSFGNPSITYTTTRNTHVL